MPRVLAEFGRGSPTGVLRYRHRRLPKQFHDNLFVFDWTFGRILSVSDDGNVTLVARPIGTTGFAVTDIDALPDGRLVVSVGGRGSRGGIYIIDTIRPLPEAPAAKLLWTRQPLPKSDPTVDWTARLRDRAQRAIDPEAASHAVGQLRGDAEPELIAAITLLIESVGGLGPGDPKDARGTEQVAAVFDGYRSRLRPKLDSTLLQQAADSLLAFVNSAIGVGRLATRSDSSAGSHRTGIEGGV